LKLNNLTGKIIKSVGGFFHVEASDGVLLCNARGLFRLQNITPVVGDNVVVEIKDGTPLITDVLPRKNHIIRPPLSNLDAAVIVVSTIEPVPNLLVLDKLIAIFESKEIQPVLLFTKTDRLEDREIREIYVKAGFTVFSLSNESGEGVEEFKTYLLEGNKTVAFIGNTGVGKSSTLNSLFPELMLETAEISKKLGRGKHTTRHAELYGFGNGCYIADTPGFSTVEAAKYGKLHSEDVALYFREIAPFVGKCKCGGCRHIKEEDCAVINAKKRGEITESRFNSYVRIFEDTYTDERNYK